MILKTIPAASIKFRSSRHQIDGYNRLRTQEKKKKRSDFRLFPSIT